eukprot:1109698-Rhodomonas_salina.2
MSESEQEFQVLVRGRERNPRRSARGKPFNGWTDSLTTTTHSISTLPGTAGPTTRTSTCTQ